jgi:hypothetical protein
MKETKPGSRKKYSIGRNPGRIIAIGHLLKRYMTNGLQRFQSLRENRRD